MTTYDTAVAEARTLLRRSESDQWRLAELTWEQVQAGASFRQWGKDTGISDRWAGVLYKTWDKWHSAEAFARPPFSEAWRDFLNTGREAEGGQEIGRAKSTIRNMPPERRAEVVREVLADPEVTEQVFADPSTRRRATTAIHKSHADDERQLAQARQERVERGERPDFERSIDVTALCADLASVVMRTDRITGIISRLTERDRTLLAFSARRAQASVDYLAGLEGNASVDDELAELFGGEQA